MLVDGRQYKLLVDYFKQQIASRLPRLIFAMFRIQTHHLKVIDEYTKVEKRAARCLRILPRGRGTEWLRSRATHGATHPTTHGTAHRAARGARRSAKRATKFCAEPWLHAFCVY